MKALKVYRLLVMVPPSFPDDAESGGHQRAAVVAAPTQTKAAELLRVSVSFLKGYGMMTANADDLAVANSQPGTVFFAGLRKIQDQKGEWQTQWYRGKESGWETVSPQEYKISREI